MLLVQRVFTRPNTDVQFYEPTQEYRDHYKAAYRDTGKFLNTTKHITAGDPLKQVVSIIWESNEAWESFKADPVCQAHFAARNAYNEANGILSAQSVADVE